MRRRAADNGISVRAIAGSHTVLLGLDATASARKGLLGFAIKRSDVDGGESYWLRGMKTFAATSSRHAPGASVSTWENPLQDFSWGDYDVEPGRRYAYTVVPVYGQPGSLQHGRAVTVKVSSENEDNGGHAVFFNRGVAGSQAYARLFGNRSPDDIGEPAFRWLSRGLLEAMLEFIGQAKKGSSLFASVYEFTYAPVLDAFRAAVGRGAEVHIVYDNKRGGPGDANREAIQRAKLTRHVTPRESNPSYISHNKFILLMDGDTPVQVWTGSTNITEGGIFGHSNLGHVVRDRRIARAYLGYWKQLRQDPDAKLFRPWNDGNSPVPSGPTVRYRKALFSPRGSLEALQWYAQQMDEAGHSVFLTAAFGVNKLFQSVLAKDRDYLRYVLLDKPGKGLQAMRRDPDNRFAIGAVLDESSADAWMQAKWASEKLTGLNRHVQYIHTKYMLVDPLSDDPVVISGSANFSENSVRNNDENMLVVRGDARVSDLYLTEFMRLFDHFRFRGMRRSAIHGRGPVPFTHLAPDDSWTADYYREGHPKMRERELFR